MLLNFFKFAFRRLARNKVFSLINIFGLAVGLATCLLILLYVFDELGYDRHHESAERIYRIETRVEGEPEPWASLGAPYAAGLKAELPEIEQSTRLLKFPGLEKMQLTYDNGIEKKQFGEGNGYYVDSTFFQIFSYQFTTGDPQTALYTPNSVVLSEPLAQKLFGQEDPLNKTIKVGLSFGTFDYTVKGVYATEGVKSHIPASFLLSLRNSDVGAIIQNWTSWAYNNIFHTYVRLQEGASLSEFDQKMQAVLDRRGGADLKAAGVHRILYAKPLQDIYLHSNLAYEIAPNGNIGFLYILGSIAAFILLIACINFMNLSTARSEKRTKEIGVRKVIGARKGVLIRQFLGESFLMSTLALGLALVLATGALPVFNSLIGKELELLQGPQFILWIAALAVLTGLLAGLYPAFYLSSFKPIAVLKGRMMQRLSVVAVRKGLVVLQFVISISLIVGALVIVRQLDFLKNQHLGFKKEQQIIISLENEEVVNNYQTLRNELLQHPDIQMVTSGSTYPGIQNINDMLFYPEGKTVNEIVDISLATVENGYIETLGFEMLYGRAFSEAFTADSLSLILNETALKRLGYAPEEAVGKKVHYDFRGQKYTMQIVGVVKDFNFESLHNDIKPYGFATSFFGNKYRYLIAGVNTADYARLLTDIERSWRKVNADTPFAYSFLDQDFQKNYEKDQRTARIVGYFTIIAIVIACLGLFGLTAFAAAQRTREVGIRKVLGASVFNLTTLLSKDLIRLVLIAIVLSSPLAWWVMNKWLQNFAYQIDIPWWLFVTAGVLAIAVAFITMSFQTIRAALANPVQSLRSE